jgi:hypothetical protein
MSPFPYPEMQHPLPSWLLNYEPNSDFEENFNSIINESAFYPGAGSDFEISNSFLCSQWVYSSWGGWRGSVSVNPGLRDPDYKCIVNQTILPEEDFQGEGGYEQFLKACLELFGFPTEEKALYKKNRELGEDFSATRRLTGSTQHFVNFQVYQWRQNIRLLGLPVKPLRKCILYVCGLESIFLYRLLYKYKKTREFKPRCKLFLKKLGLGVRGGNEPEQVRDGNEPAQFVNDEELNALLTDTLGQSKPDYFVNSTAYPDNENKINYFDLHLEYSFLRNNYNLLEKKSFREGRADSVDLFFYEKKDLSQKIEADDW